MSTELKTKYFSGIGTLISRQLGYTDRYVRGVLNGEYKDRDTKAVKEIKKRAEELIS